MSNKKTHIDIQKSVCVMCFRKPKHMKNISEKVKISIKELVLHDYDEDEWSWLPTVICNGCYKDLYDCKTDSK